MTERTTGTKFITPPGKSGRQLSMIATIINRNISTIHQRSLFRSASKSVSRGKCQSCHVKHRFLSSKSGTNKVHVIERTNPSRGSKKVIDKVISTKLRHKDIKSNESTNIQPYLVAFATGTAIAYSIYTRKWRERQLGTLPPAQECGIFYSNCADDGIPIDHFDCLGSVKRNIDVLALTVERTGLMVNKKPGTKSVKDELDRIRSWHQNKGFRGGLVLRELNQPLYQNGSSIESGDDVDSILQPDQLHQRECYYLYYEIKPNGQIVQQIFCRGTTILADVWTCLQSDFVLDEELGIRVHRGFRDHAIRLVNDVEPLLGQSNNPRATVEVCGHSLGGAVAMIVSMKLKKRGYNVVRSTAIAGARFCHEDCIERAEELLPEDTLRIEDDMDGVPFLPPWAHSVGPKLWLASCGNGAHFSYYIPKNNCQRTSPFKEKELSWVDSFWTNCRLFETIASVYTTHRIPSHTHRIRELADEIRKYTFSKEANTTEEEGPIGAESSELEALSSE